MGPRALAFVMIVSACSAGAPVDTVGPVPTAPAAPVETTVELDVFSGRPNPSWQATPAEAGQVLAKLGGLVRVDGGEPPVAVLGYRGFRLALGGGQSPRRYEVGSGLIVGHPTPESFEVWRDDGLEDLLLEHARHHGQDDILRALMK